jgi:hypothetical protein
VSTPAGILLLLLGCVVAGLAVAALVLRRRARLSARRDVGLTAVAKRIDDAVASLRAPNEPLERFSPSPPGPAPMVGEALPGRAALVDAVASGVAVARVDGGRLAAALVRAPATEDAEKLACDVREVVGVTAYAVGPRSVALVLPGLGRADALGLLARVEARCASTGLAVELEPDEDAAELVCRLLGSAPTGE